jgi:hypothetical protein
VNTLVTKKKKKSLVSVSSAGTPPDGERLVLAIQGVSCIKRVRRWSFTAEAAIELAHMVLGAASKAQVTKGFN